MRPLVLFLSSLVLGVLGVQKGGLALPDYAAEQGEAVKAIFVESYAAYCKYAWSHDDLRPESLSHKDSRNGWGASIIDAMSTMYIMGLDDDLERAIHYAGRINFNSSGTKDSVSVFETTIRYMAGLLSVYELRGEKDTALLNKAKEVADKLSFAWVGTCKARSHGA